MIKCDKTAMVSKSIWFGNIINVLLAFIVKFQYDFYTLASPMPVLLCASCPIVTQYQCNINTFMFHVYRWSTNVINIHFGDGFSNILLSDITPWTHFCFVIHRNYMEYSVYSIEYIIIRRKQCSVVKWTILIPYLMYCRPL